MIRFIELAALVGVFATACSEPSPAPHVCGNGVVEAESGEECDLGDNNADDGACTATCSLAVCGDGLIQAVVEECDDGDANKPTPDGEGGCSTKCEVLAVCGDGVLDPGEDCDDGNSDDGDGCPSTCHYPYCGNAVVEPGEGCDDGNSDDTDACPTTCQPAKCGDGYVHDGVEECDDGNEDNSDACLNACIAAKCGDGVLRPEVEECDDGNDVPDDGCNADCVRDRLVFLTEEPLSPSGFKSLFGADNLCRKTAMDYGYSNFDSFRAWLSDDTTSPATTFHKSPGRYVLVTGEVVAESWADLTDGALSNGIDRTLSGEKLYGHAVWTSTRPDGSSWDDSLDCLNWSSYWPEENARQGITGYTDTRWTDDELLTICAGGGLLYCFEQE